MDVLNWSRLEESTGGDEEFARELLEDYAHVLADEVHALKDAIEGMRYVEGRSHAHALKGASASVGAQGVAGAAQALEKRCQVKDEDGSFEALKELEREVSQYFEWYEGWRTAA